MKPSKNAMKRLSTRVIDPPSSETFRDSRKRLRWSIDQAADFLWVTPMTIRNWESGRGKIPYAAFRLLRMRAGHAVAAAGWDGWTIGHKGELVAPTGRCFMPSDLSWLTIVFEQARHWRESYADRMPAFRQVPIGICSPLVTRGESRTGLEANNGAGVVLQFPISTQQIRKSS